MKKASWGMLLLVLSAPVWAQDACPVGQFWDDCQGPAVGGTGPCTPGCKPVPGFVPPPPAVTHPVGPARLCFGDAGCKPVRYRFDGGFVLAESALPSGYRVLGWSGPCPGALSTCPGLGGQAYSDLRVQALRLHRAQVAP